MERNEIMKIFSIFDDFSQEAIKILTDNGIEVDLLPKGEARPQGEELKNLKFQSDYVRARSRALWYLDRMDYSEKALFDKLTQKGFEKKASSAVIAKLVELGLLDDRRFGERLCEKLISSGNSKRAAMQKMFQKGLPYDLCRELLEEKDSDEEDAILKLIEKKYAQKLESKENYQKVYAALVRRGFSYGDVSRALKKYLEDFSED